MTKEKIREKHLFRNGLSVNKGDVGQRIQKAAFGAMDEFAKQECIELINFLMEDERLMEDEGDANKLYNLYLQNKNNE